MDRWVVTDDATSGGDPANFHVIFGAGDVLETPTFVGTTVFDSAGTLGVRADFPLSVAPGSTQALLFFNQVSPTNAGALTGASTLDSEVVPTGALLARLTADEMNQVVNFVTPESAVGAALALLAGVAVPATLRRRGRQKA